MFDVITNKVMTREAMVAKVTKTAGFMKKHTNISSVDLFCGAGGLTHGFILEGVPVNAGIDLDPVCRYPYEINNDVEFLG